jgi:DNA-binding GntR family transcriptional regulator
MHFPAHLGSVFFERQIGPADHPDETPLGDATKVRLSYLRLKDAVKTYRIRPNVRLHPDEIARQLGVSVTPVREALIRLHVEGFVDLFPKRGFRTKALDEREQLELIDFSEIIVISSIRVAANIYPDHSLLAQLSTQDWDGEPPFRLTRAIDKVFAAIVGYTGNDDLLRTIVNCCDRTHYLRAIHFTQDAIATSVIDAFRTTALSMARSDVDQAVSTLRSFFSTLRLRLPSLVKDANYRAFSSGDVNQVPE